MGVALSTSHNMPLLKVKVEGLALRCCSETHRLHLSQNLQNSETHFWLDRFSPPTWFVGSPNNSTGVHHQRTCCHFFVLLSDPPVILLPAEGSTGEVVPNQNQRLQVSQQPSDKLEQVNRKHMAPEPIRTFLMHPSLAMTLQPHRLHFREMEDKQADRQTVRQTDSQTDRQARPLPASVSV